MVRVLSDSDVASVLELEELLPVLAEAFERQYAGEVERPERPHFPIGTGLDPDEPTEPTGTGLCMPAYIHGEPYAATKLATVCPDNPDRGLPTVTAQLALTDAETGQPLSYMAANRITSARTGCIGGLAARELAPSGPIELGVIGAGRQARWQTRAIAAAVGPRLESIRVYSPSDSKVACAEELEAELGAPASAVGTAREAVAEASVVVTATTSTEPVFPGEALSAGTLVVAVGAYTPEMRELDATTVDRAATIVGDVPEEAAETGDLREHGDRELIPLGGVLSGEFGRESPDDVVVAASVGSAVLDVATAGFVYDRALEADLGTENSL